MNVIEFIKTIYLGDRGCMSLLIDGWNAEVKVQVDSISRVRSDSWDFYVDEDLEEGFLVFEGVSWVSLDPPGVIPNDFINSIEAEPLAGSDHSRYLIVMSIGGSVDPPGATTEVTVRIHATAMALEDSHNPGVRIRD